MKRLFTLLWLALTAFTFKAGAQTTTCNAEFGWNFINGNTVKFTPAVNDSPVVHHLWNFGDGSATSQVVSPTHSYLSNGSYNVVHTVIRYSPNGAAICTQSITHTILIQQAPCELVVDFSWNATATNPLMIEFHNLSTPSSPSDSTTWTFGDGSNSYAANPVHTYANAGTYTVCLVVKKNNNTTGTTPCIRYKCKTIVVQAPCTLQANFTWHASPTNAQNIQFTNTSAPLSSTDSIRWTFGDGSSSNAVNPNHTYTQPGSYNVCLRVQKRNSAGTLSNCISEICKTV